MTRKVSVLIPAHNEKIGIQRTLDSIHDSSRDGLDFQEIVCCNACTDGTEEIVSRYPVKLIQEPMRGKPNALNALMGCARELGSDYLCFVDADVRVGKDSIARLVHDLETTGYKGVGGRLEPDTEHMNFSQQMSTMPFRVAEYKYMPGAFYCVRQYDMEGIRFPPEIILDDVWISMTLGDTSVDDEAVVYFTPPRTFGDFWEQTKRRMIGIYQLEENFPPELLEELVPHTISKNLRELDREKLRELSTYEKFLFTLSVPIYSAMKLKAYMDYRHGNFSVEWEQQESTKPTHL